MQNSENSKICPKCLSDKGVIEKKLLIGKASPTQLLSRQKAGYRRPDQLAVDECKPEVLQEAPLEQFVAGYYCDKCGIGFVPDSFAIGSKA